MSSGGFPSIRIISAGAGSGKTHRLTEELARSLDPSVENAARPEGVVATTFTRRAAAELCERTRKILFAAGRDAQADRLVGGLIGTVNSVCGRLLARFAFEAGLSPELQVIEEQDQALLFNQALADVLEAKTIDDLNRLDHVFGYDFTPPGEERKDWRSHIRAIIDAARCNALDAGDVRESARRSLDSLLAFFPAPDPAGADVIDRELEVALDHALTTIAATDDDTKGTATYVGELRDVLSTMRRGHALPWSRWAKLSKDLPTKKSRKAAEPVLVAAARQTAHPRLRDDVTRYIRTLFDVAASSIETYQRWKRERGLIDFIDQEALVLTLLERNDVRKVLASELDVTFIDEFQDTSPIQLAVFLQLVRLASRSVWVGDPKQSIYAFRGADPELMDAVVATAGSIDARDILSESHRSRPALVNWVSELFAGAFADRWPRERVVLSAVRKEDPGLPSPLQAWVLPVKNNAEEASALANGVATLLGRRGGDPAQVFDRESKTVRPVKPGDVAVLCRTNDRCAEVACALERAGVRAALARAGLLRTPEAILTLAAIRLLIDASDSLARAEIVALTSDDPEPEGWLADRLEHLAVGKPSNEWAGNHPVMLAIEGLRAELQWLTPSEVLDRVICGADVLRLVLGWGRGELRIGNLDALRHAAAAYEDHCARRGAAATAAGLLTWLADNAKAGQDEQSEGIGENSVAVLTWHGAKGLEWPVVVVADLDKDVAERLWEVVMVNDAPSVDLSDPLAGRWIRFWPWPYGRQQAGIPLADAVANSTEKATSERAAQDEFLRVLYVALTRARDVLVLPARPRRGGGLAHAGLDRLLLQRDGYARFALPDQPGQHSSPVQGSTVGIDVETRIHLPSDPVATDVQEDLWFPPPPETRERVRPRARLAASALAAGPPSGPATILETMDVGPRLTLVGDPDEQLLGNALHGFLAADDSAMEAPARIDLAGGLLRRHSIPGAVQPAEMLARSDSLRAALSRRYEIHAWHREWPVRLRRNGTVIVGFADLVLDTVEGWVIVDHKSFKGRRDQWPAKVAEYREQLRAYAEAIERATARKIAGVWVHFVVGGGLVSVTSD